MVSRISAQDETCPISNVAMARRAKVFPIKRGSGKYYVHFAEVYNAEGTGYLQRLAPVEKAVFEAFEALQEGWYATGKPDVTALRGFYGSVDFGLDVK